jgi:hypothetical protein
MGSLSGFDGSFGAPTTRRVFRVHRVTRISSRSLPLALPLCVSLTISLSVSDGRKKKTRGRKKNKIRKERMMILSLFYALCLSKKEELRREKNKEKEEGEP